MKILVCIDGSKTAGEALRFACEIAKEVPSDITLLHVEKCDLCSVLPSLRMRLMRFGRKSSESIFRKANDILGAYRLKAARRIRAGSIESEIVSEANGGRYDFVVFGSQGVKGIEMFFFGALSYRLIERIRKPVLVVRKGRKKISRILVCTGGSEQADKAVRFAAGISSYMKAQVTLLHVREGDGVQGLCGSSEVLKKSGELFVSGSGKVEKILLCGHRSEKIVETAKTGDYDLIVLGETSMNPLKLLVSGSVVYEVLKGVKTPCLIVK